MGVTEGKISGVNSKPRVDLDTFSFSLKVLIKCFVKVGTKRVIIVTPMPIVSSIISIEKETLKNEIIKPYSDIALKIAGDTGADVLDVFSICMDSRREKDFNVYAELMAETIIAGILESSCCTINEHIVG
jgi:hypothetical protein